MIIKADKEGAELVMNALHKGMKAGAYDLKDAPALAMIQQKLELIEPTDKPEA